ncbi:MULTISPECIES: universal stress protein [Gordonia]|uniref:Usp family protein n=2 Tax=Gordonia TaxID=2053 RepID=L7LLB3_9ACTN|nr:MULTISPECIES: universal stress protein [Gordonia]AUH67604.1 universal stress protein [Gordonia sp. YC-JH1]KJR07499.1 universal stress protein UspA [Gordonia sihwensis]MBY4568711.1 universal stress protein UspA [Gordonia sihwensis]WFN92726.1 universal stress protein [Gordonia sihwensis]GAC61506.1 Usp family protein [Gordonia sihwensis NBRC 108236]
MSSADAPVVVAVDGSVEALNAARWAALAAARLHRDLHIVSAVHPFSPQFSFAGLSAEDAAIRAARAFAETATQTATDLAAEVAPDVTAHRHIVEGRAALVLRDASTRAHLLVVGRRGLGGVQGLLMGSVSTDITAHANCPVVVVPGRDDAVDDRPGTGPVVVGVDDSPLSEAVIAHGFDQAASLGTSLTAVHAYGGLTGEEFYDDPSVLERARTEADETLAEHLAAYADDFPGVETTTVITAGTPADEINRIAADAQLVVIGSRGHGGFRGLLLGSTSQAVLQVAGCPVMVVHEDR